VGQDAVALAFAGMAVGRLPIRPRPLAQLGPEEEQDELPFEEPLRGVAEGGVAQ
jgi:hypothetical protein